MSYFLRAGIWFFKGMREYTKQGYEAASKHFDPDDLIVDLSGKIAMVTGSNSGIGKATATALAGMGAEVHLVCRNRERAEVARKEIVESTGNENVHWHQLDLSVPRDVARFAKNFDKPLHILVNNAGCMVHERQLDADGLEKNFATNTLGTYILTVGLIPALKKGISSNEKPRVIVVSSGGMYTELLDNDLNSEKSAKFDGMSVYSKNKRQQVVLCEKLAEEYPEIFFASMHPGWADTDAVRSAMPGFHSWMKSMLRTAEQGADTVVWLCAANKAVEAESGSFFQDRRVVPKHLPFAGTTPYPEDEAKLMLALDEYHVKFSKA